LFILAGHVAPWSEAFSVTATTAAAASGILFMAVRDQ